MGQQPLRGLEESDGMRQRDMQFECVVVPPLGVDCELERFPLRFENMDRDAPSFAPRLSPHAQ